MKVWLTVMVWSLLGTSLAWADVVNPPPEDCPAGTQGSTCHGGPHCAPVDCGAAGCKDGLECREVKYCAGVVNCAGMLMPDEDPSQYDTDAIYTTCDADESCDMGTCQAFKVCIEPAVVPTDDTATTPDDTGPVADAAPAAEKETDAGGAVTGTKDDENDGCNTGVVFGTLASLLAALFLIVFGRRR